MDGPIFPEGTEVHASALQDGEQQKAFHIQRRFIDSTRPGRASGLTLSAPGSDAPGGATRFGISCGWGYTPRGDIVEFSGETGIALSDYTTGVENLIVLCYRENPGSPEPFEDGGSTRNTISTRSAQLKVITRAAYNSLPPYADGDLATNLKVADTTKDSQDRTLILASIFGKGFTGSTPNAYTGLSPQQNNGPTGDFANGTIVQQDVLGPFLTAIAPPNVAQSTVIQAPGINIKAISPNTPVGFGTLRLFILFGGGWSIGWNAPDSSGHSSAPVAGTVTISASNVPQVLTITSGTATSDPVTPTIQIEVVTDLFPVVLGTRTDVYVIKDLYTDPGAAFSTIDNLHRSKLGSYVPTAMDPHGTGYPDFAQQVAIIPSPIVAGTGYLGSAIQQALARLVVPGASVGRTGFFDTGSNGSYHIRGYYNADAKRFEITTNCRWDPSVNEWIPDIAGFNPQLYYFTSTGVVTDGFTGLTRFSTALSPFHDTDFFPQLSIGGATAIGHTLRDTAIHATIPRIKVDRSDNLQRTLLFRDDANGEGGVANLDIYLCGNDAFDPAQPPSFEFAIGAEFDQNGNWNKYGTNHPIKFSMGEDGFEIVTFNATSISSWVDTSWVTVLTLTPQKMTYSGIVDVGSGRLATDGTDQVFPRFLARISPGGVANARWLASEIKMINSSIPASVRKYVYYDGSNYFHEEVFGAIWNPAGGFGFWSPDSNNASLLPTMYLVRYTTSGVLFYYKTNTAGTWLDSGWTKNSFSLTDSLYLQSAAPSPPAANTLYSFNMPKAFIKVSQANSGASFVTLDSFNASITIDSSTSFASPLVAPSAKITFNVPFVGSYTAVSSWMSSNNGSSNNVAGVIFPEIAMSPTSCHGWYNQVDGHTVPVNSSENIYREWSVMFFGAQ